MATTPEGKIKAKVSKLLKQLGVWYFYPASGPMGRIGIPDIIAIFGGKFVGIECKADPTKKPTALQVRVGQEIIAAGGEWFLVRSTDDIQQLGEFFMDKRVQYSVEDNALVAKFAGESIKLDVPKELSNELALYGLRAYIQNNSAKTDNRIEEIEKTYDDLLHTGAAAFERKTPVGNRVQFRKADKVMALAVLKGVTITVMQDALSKLDPERQNKVLNSEAVMKKLHSMQDEISLEG